ncbi:hypothetical protein ACFL6S_14435 [Candidatus Poribacteria bacterium]
MALNVRNRVPAVNVLQTDYEYCTISYYTEGTRNDFGEPTRILAERAANIRCSIDPLNQTPSHIRQSGLRDILRQGVIERSVYIMTLLAGQAIESGDIVTDYDGSIYDVLHVVNWYTHKEAFIRKMN